MGAFYVKLRVNWDTEIKCKIDTGVDVSCMGLKPEDFRGSKLTPYYLNLKDQLNLNME